MPEPAVKVCSLCGGEFAADAVFCPQDGNRLAARVEPVDPYVGQEIAQHIEIRALIGSGAMGKVYRAFQRGIDRDVAVKILHRELGTDHQIVARFHQEAKVASRLQHPNVVHLHMDGQLPDGSLFIAMEFLSGTSLDGALATAGTMPLSRAMHITLQICDAVGEAHAQGIVHRDLKPENIMLVRRAEDPDFVKVLDFGIARVLSGDRSIATNAGLIFGTPRYMSPEAARGEVAGPAADVYAIATMLYQMLGGRTPFDADAAFALLIKQIHDTPAPLQTIAAPGTVPEAIAAIVMRNLGKNPALRDVDARALRRSLAEVSRGPERESHDPARARPIEATLDDRSLAGTALASMPPPALPVEAPRRGRFWPKAVVAAVVLFGFAAFAVFAFPHLRERQALDAFVERAEGALRQDHFYEPPGENVRDLTNEGFRRWPGDPRLLAIRQRAAEELVSQSLASRLSGDGAAATRLAQVALELDANSVVAKRLATIADAGSARLPPPDASAETAHRPPKKN